MASRGFIRVLLALSLKDSVNEGCAKTMFIFMFNIFSRVLLRRHFFISMDPHGGSRLESRVPQTLSLLLPNLVECDKKHPIWEEEVDLGEWGEAGIELNFKSANSKLSSYCAQI